MVAYRPQLFHLTHPVLDILNILNLLHPLLSEGQHISLTSLSLPLTLYPLPLGSANLGGEMGKWFGWVLRCPLSLWGHRTGGQSPH